MKIVVCGDQRRIGAWEGDHIVDLNRAYAMALRESGDSNPEATALERLGTDLEGFIVNGTIALDAAEEAIGYVAVTGLEGGAAEPVDQVKVHAPWPRRRIACVGGNYADHLAGITGEAPEEAARSARELGQWGFWKEPFECAGPGDDVPYPTRAEYLDYEGEVAIVIGKRGKNVPADRVEEYIWGVTLMNDLSIREYDDGPPRRVVPMSYNLAKNFDGSSPIGPVIVVREDLDPAAIDVETRVNGEVRQRYNSSAMIFSFGEVLEYLSTDFTFVPGDIISGGTAMGTAADQTPPPADGSKRPTDLFVKPGDTVEVWSPQIGLLTNRIV
jgi:acylpyruvate hydrolase